MSVFVWCWEEHLKAKELLGEKPESRAVVLIDEVETHLHPKWQRTVVPTLLKAMEVLRSREHLSETQFVVATHSPLVAASVATLFDDQKDAWLDLELVDRQLCLRMPHS